MKNLRINLDYSRVADAPYSRGGSLVGLPVVVLDSDGSELGKSLARFGKPTLFSELEVEVAFVRLTWPSGKTETKRVTLLSDITAEVTFSDANISANEWAAWAIPILNPRTPLNANSGNLDLNLKRFDRVWIRLWRFAQGNWDISPLQPRAQYRSGVALQIDLELDDHPWLLQIGGAEVPWRFISLPGAGPARVLITPKDSVDPRADPLKVVVTSFRRVAETLLEFLARDSMRAAGAMAESETMAQELFSEKYSDPIAAVAGAYYLLRIDEWQRIPLSWYANLCSDFPWLPDSAIIYCIRLLREGMDTQTEQLAHTLFDHSLQRGWPIYSEGLLLLQEAASLLQRNPSDCDRVSMLGAARAWAGAALSFYGKEPGFPSQLLWVGMPSAPQSLSLNPDLWKNKMKGSQLYKTANSDLLELANDVHNMLGQQMKYEHADDENLLFLEEIGSIERVPKFV